MNKLCFYANIYKMEDVNRVINFGCRLNSSESALITQYLKEFNIEQVIVINTCAVTTEAERQARQSIRKTKAQYPNHHIVVTGCSAQIKPNFYAQMPQVSLVIGNAEKIKKSTYQTLSNYVSGNLFSMLKNAHKNIIISDIMEITEAASHMSASFNDKARVFVEIQNGCNHRCTFCTIPFARGNNRSLNPHLIVEEIKNLVALGYREVVLTGVDITDYGLDINNSLHQLVNNILTQVPDLPNLRLSSLDPFEITPQLVELLITQPRLLPYVHLSMQSGDDLILKRMKRRHLSHHLISLVNTLNHSGRKFVFGADIIVGFPTETTENFNNTCQLIENLNISLLHLFSFSAHPNTPASKMPQVPGPIIKNRMHLAMQLKNKLIKQIYDQLLQVKVPALVEQQDNNSYILRTNHYLYAKIEATKLNLQVGQLVEIIPQEITFCSKLNHGMYFKAKLINIIG